MQQLGYFYLLNELSQGVWGPAYRAWDLRRARTVSLKTLRLQDCNGADPGQWRSKLVQDFRRLGRLTNSRIATTYGLEKDGEFDFFVIESVDGPSLDQLMVQDDLIDLTLGLKIWQQTGEALDWAHGQGLVHGSLRPQSILLDAEANVKVADWGLTELFLALSRKSEDKPLPVDFYAAPERIAHTPPSARADQYSFAAIVYEMIAGRVPFSAGTMAELQQKQVSGTYPPMRGYKPQTPAGVDAVLQRALAAAPEMRFASCAELVEQLERELGANGAARPRPAATVSAVPQSSPLLDPNATAQLPAPGPVVTQPEKVVAPQSAQPIAFTPIDEREENKSNFTFPLLLVLLLAMVGGLVWYLSHSSGPSANWREVGSFIGHEKPVLSVLFTPSQQDVVSGSLDHTVRLWNVASKQPDKTFDAGETEIASVALSPDGGLLAAASNKTTVKMWDLTQGNAFRTLQAKDAITSPVAFSSDGDTVAVGTKKGEIQLWQSSTGKTLRSWKAHEAAVFAVAFSPDGKTIASAGTDMVVRTWNVEDGARQLELSGHDKTVDCLAFSADGRTLASGSFDLSIRLWAMPDGKLIKTMEGAAKPIYAIALRPDGQQVASGGGDGLVTLWDVATGKSAQQLKGHDGAITSLAYNKDGSLLASASEDKSVKLWGSK